MRVSFNNLISPIMLSCCFFSLLFDSPREIYLFSKIFLNIYFSDKTLCFLFGNISRWYQLHSLINIYITYETYSDYLLFLKDPINAMIYKDTYFIGYTILCLHLYHVIMFTNLNLLDCFHHVLFVGISMLPSMIWFKENNTINLLYFTGCGFTGAIEYFLLSLKKHNLIKRNNQKLLTSYIYNYIRYPSSIYSIIMLYIHFKNGNLPISYFKLLFTMLMSFLNGSYYNYVTLVSFGKLKSNI